MNTTKQTIEVDVPVGWRVSSGPQPRQAKDGEFVLRHGGTFQVRSCQERWFIVIEPDPTYIDTTTIEYRLEVHRQWLLGKKIQRMGMREGVWDCAVGFPSWNWEASVYRVTPEGTDELGPYYLDGERKVYVPK